MGLPVIKMNPDGSIAGGHYLDCVTSNLVDSPFVVLLIRYIEGPEHNARVREGLDEPRELQLFVPLDSSRGLVDALNKAVDALETGERPAQKH
jgi:hypothetical protein